MGVTFGPGMLVSGAGFAAQTPTVESPLPGGVATVVRFLLNLPAWFQITGIIVAALATLGFLWFLWGRRRQIATWAATRPRNAKIGLAAAAAVLLLFGAGFGAVSWNYTQHDNGFCTGCHVMGPSYARFAQSEHSTLSCHDCHQQSVFASMRQLYLWVAERPAEIGPHARVPNAVCAECHVTGEKQVWQRIASTAGHRTHLDSKNPKLANFQCVDCHGVEVHHFAPIDRTCAQSGCHEMSEIALGQMRGQTALHCTTCHRFTAEVPALATRDSVAGTLTPGSSQCFSCHEMRERLAGMNMDPGQDPHAGSCGMCHNPHRQENPTAARATCAQAGCHADWRSEPFHVGATHRRVNTQCSMCHLPHQARVDASDCAGCHQSVRERVKDTRVRPPLPFDTTRARPNVSWMPPDELSEPRRRGPAPPAAAHWPAEFLAAAPVVLTPSFAPVVADTFSHDRHRALACITCHATTTPGRRLTFAPPRGCQFCHHDAPAASACGKCHDPGEHAAPEDVPVRVTVAGHAARDRLVRFSHATHQQQRCVDCHTTPVTLEADPTVTCGSCHENHHTERADCGLCHTAVEPRLAHAPLADAHIQCASCHDEAIVARLTPNRTFCRTCHAEQADHYPGRECTNCHFLASPAEFRMHLRTAEDGD